MGRFETDLVPMMRAVWTNHAKRFAFVEMHAQIVDSSQ
jgi:hypothetical protein